MSKSGTMVGLGIAAFVALVSVEARADQCAWVDKAVAQAAAKYLTPKSAWAQFCEPCGDTKPVYHTVGAVQVRPTDSGGYHEVVIDGVAVDLAYVFAVRSPEDKKLGNLALLAGCPATGVSKTIPLPPAK